MPKTMKATVFVEPGRIELREKPVPEQGQVNPPGLRLRSGNLPGGRGGGFLAHLPSTTVTMRKNFVAPQRPQSVPRTPTPDIEASDDGIAEAESQS